MCAIRFFFLSGWIYMGEWVAGDCHVFSRWQIDQGRIKSMMKVCFFFCSLETIHWLTVYTTQKNAMIINFARGVFFRALHSIRPVNLSHLNSRSLFLCGVGRRKVHKCNVRPSSAVDDAGPTLTSLEGERRRRRRRKNVSKKENYTLGWDLWPWKALNTFLLMPLSFPFFLPLPFYLFTFFFLCCDSPLLVPCNEWIILTQSETWRQKKKKKIISPASAELCSDVYLGSWHWALPSAVNHPTKTKKKTPKSAQPWFFWFAAAAAAVRWPGVKNGLLSCVHRY
jgi:hypothetical protein